MKRSAYIDIASIFADFLAGELVKPLALIRLGDLGDYKRHGSYISFLFPSTNSKSEGMEDVRYEMV